MFQGTKVAFAKEGNQGPNHIPADIVFVVKYKEHPRFKREVYASVLIQEMPIKFLCRAIILCTR